MSEKSFLRVLKFCLGLNILFIICTIFLNHKMVADEFEHIHCAWLVWQGQIPYTDFFEHHNFLMWYLFAPLVGGYARDIGVFFVLRGIMSAISVATLYVIYRTIKDFFADKTVGLLALCIFCASMTVQSVLVLFKPDTFMHLFFWLGLYLLFKFMREHKEKYLNLSMIMFTIGFLFLQTMIFLVLPLGLVMVYLLYKKQIKIGALLKSMIVPTIMILITVAFLYGCSNLQRYWQLNWAINSEISASVKEKIVDFSDLYLILLCGILSAAYLLYKKPDIYVGTILLLYVNELIWRTLYFSIKLYYFKVALLYNAIVIALAFGKIYKRFAPAAYVLSGLLLVFNCRFFAAENLNNKMLIETLGLIRSVSQNSAPEDKFLGISKLPLGVFNDNAHYYWFSYDYIGEIDQKKYNYAGWYDINKILKETRPEFVHFEGDLLPNYKAVSRYDINVDILHKYYKTKGYNVLYVPKDEKED